MTGVKSSAKVLADNPTEPPTVATTSPGPKNEEEHQDIDIDDLFGSGTPEEDNVAEEKDNVGFDINVPHQNDTDDEIADVDDSGDEVDKGPNAAEALRAQVNAEGRDEQSSSSSSSSGSGSSGSGSGSGSSSSSDSEGSDEDSVTSIWEIVQIVVFSSLSFLFFFFHFKSFFFWQIVQDIERQVGIC